MYSKNLLLKIYDCLYYLNMFVQIFYGNMKNGNNWYTY